MKRRWFFIICLTLVSCKSRNIAGTYSSNNIPYRFILNDDSFFTYQYKEGLIYSFSVGNWTKIAKDEVQLQSFAVPQYLPAIGSEQASFETTKLCELKIEIPIPEGVKKYYECLIYIDNKFVAKKHCDSISSVMVPNPIKSVLLKITADQRIPSRAGDTISSDYITKAHYLTSMALKCEYNDSLFNYKLFDKTRLKISNGKLIFMGSKIPKGR